MSDLLNLVGNPERFIDDIQTGVYGIKISQRSNTSTMRAGSKSVDLSVDRIENTASEISKLGYVVRRAELRTGFDVYLDDESYRPLATLDETKRKATFYRHTDPKIVVLLAELFGVTQSDVARKRLSDG